ncbi:Craniofacial development protein 2 [Eumeta japonica]|uniref:Craniofacial development protein 2 n=1 Tax=Eumeta variegata TaxID=151549 RepID=A0A4C1URK1_EUMVA|nr:Craniofacial development protein 2 [Eumeta japonica]
MDNTQPTLPRQETTMRTKTNKHTKIYIAALNVLTLRTEESLSELSLALQNTKWDILGLSEVRRIGENIIAYPDFILYHMGQTPGKHGVGFLVKKYLAKHIIGFYGVSERIALLNIKLPEYKDPWTIIQIYSPTEQAETETTSQFYQELNKTLQTYAHKNAIVMGDFNGQIGERQWDEDAIIGPFTYSSKPRSRNGKMLAGFAMENNLTILNTMFKKNKNRMWTWLSPDGKSKNQIDFIMSNKPKCFTNINVINNLNFNTNHRMVRAELNSSQPKNPRPKINPEDIKLNRYSTEENVNSLNLKLKEYKRETKDAGIQEKYNWLERTIKNTIKENKTKKENSNNWISEKTTNLLEQRSALISAKMTDNNRKEITKISKEIKENIRKDRRQRRMETIERHIRQTGDYYTELYKDNTNEREIELPDNEIIPYILQEETEKAINTQKSDKAPGPDGISNEILKQMKADLIPILTEIFNGVISTEIIPKQWTESNIILLFKKGNHSDMGNYRPISLMSNIYKNFAKVILKRIERKLDEQQPIEQAGFRRDFSVLDHIHTSRKEKCSRYKRREAGDPLSPALFLAVLENIFRKIEWRDLGININGRSITHLRFADDIVLFAKTPDDLGKMINDLASESAKFGLKLNPEKTKIMTNGKKDPVTVEQTQISYVDEYIYLGQLISPEDNINKEVERRIAKGWKKYWGAKEIMKDKTFTFQLKVNYSTHASCPY